MKKKKKSNKEITTYAFNKGGIYLREVVPNQYDDYDPSKFVAPHRRNYFSFFLLTSGTITHEIDFNRQTASHKKIFFLKPEQVYLVETAKNLGGISILFNPEILTAAETALSFISNNYGENQLEPSPAQYIFLQQHLRNMLTEYKNDEAFSAPIIRAGLTTFLLYLARIAEYQLPGKGILSEKNSITEKFLQLLASNWRIVNEVSAYAKLLHVSPGHLNEMVKQQTGKKTISWIQEKKITEIKRLLIYTEKTISEIAYETGFEDPSYFNRFFKKMDGDTPLIFRKKNHEKYHPIP